METGWGSISRLWWILIQVCNLFLTPSPSSTKRLPRVHNWKLTHLFTRLAIDEAANPSYLRVSHENPIKIIMKTPWILVTTTCQQFHWCIIPMENQGIKTVPQFWWPMNKFFFELTQEIRYPWNIHEIMPPKMIGKSLIDRFFVGSISWII